MDKNMTWDLTQMYPDLDAWQADLKKAQDIAEQIAAMQGTIIDDLIISAVHPNTVDLHKGQHHIHTDALVAIHEGVVRDERIAQPSALFLPSRVEFLPAKAGKDVLQRGLQQSLIPDADAPASLLRDEPVKQQDLLF